MRRDCLYGKVIEVDKYKMIELQRSNVTIDLFTTPEKSGTAIIIVVSD